MKRMLPRLSAALAAAAVILLSLTAASYPRPTSDFFVNDFAGVITADDAAAMQASGELLYAKTKAQVVAVTVDDLGGEEIRDYGYHIANEWGIGDADLDNGVLILLSVGDREVDIEIGKGLEGQLNDAKCGRILDYYAVPYMKDDDFSSGLAEAYNALINEVYIEYGLEPDEDYDPSLAEEDEGISYGAVAILALIIIFLLFTRRGRRILPFIFLGGRGGSSGGGGFSGGGGSFGGGGSSRGF